MTELYGNFHNYYTFNPRIAISPRGTLHDSYSAADERLKFLREAELVDELVSTFRDEAHVLDVGCNEGDLSLALYELLASALQRRAALSGRRCTLTLVGMIALLALGTPCSSCSCCSCCSKCACYLSLTSKGVDIDAELIVRAQGKSANEHVTFMHSNVMSDQFHLADFDAVFCFRSLDCACSANAMQHHHVDPPQSRRRWSYCVHRSSDEHRTRTCCR
jgi:hypothetical protein